jgi:hypothetical protein
MMTKRQYLHEYFTTVFILCGKIKHLEEIKKYIVQTYIDTGLLTMIKPTYSGKPLYAVTESNYTGNTYEFPDAVSGESYLGFILWGEVTYTENVKEYITTYVDKGLIELETTSYTKQKQYIIRA